MKAFLSVLGFLTLSISFSSLAAAQNINPADGLIFNSTDVAVIKVEMDKSEKDWLLDDDNAQNNEYLKCRLNFKNSNVDETRFDVGIRIRGNTSRSHPKKSFKFKFTEWEGEKFYGHKKFNLKATNNDPTLIRESIALGVYRKANVPAARSSHCRLFINDEFMGVYTNVEQIDDEFIDTRFGSEAGNLYKCSWGASLSDDNDIYDNALFELETNKDENDRRKLKTFIDVLNKTTDANFKSEIEKVLNVEVALRFLATEAILGHWDGYAYNMNNFYIHENPFTNKIDLIAYDVDNTFGINWIPKDWANRDLKNWAHETDARPLHNRLLGVSEFYSRYLDVCEEIIEQYFNEKVLFEEIENARDRIKSYVEQDKYFGLTFGFSYNDFLDGYNEQVINHCPYGIKPYISQRVASAAKQIPTISAINDLSTVLELKYLGNGLVQLQRDINKSSINVWGLDGRALTYKWQSNHVLFIESRKQMVILTSANGYKKLVL